MLSVFLHCEQVDWSLLFVVLLFVIVASLLVLCALPVLLLDRFFILLNRLLYRPPWQKGPYQAFPCSVRCYFRESLNQSTEFLQIAFVLKVLLETFVTVGTAML